MVFSADFLSRPLDLAQPDASAFQGTVQGNILKAHGRDHVALLLVAFKDDAGAIRTWITGPLRKRLTSAADPMLATARWRASAGAGTPFVAFLLSHDGYRRLGLGEAEIPGDPYFRAGMKGTPQGVALRVADPPVAEWEPAFRDRIDAMILLGHDDGMGLDALVATVSEDLEPLAERLWVERGDKLRFDFPDRPGVEIEHFGHQDGISQPQMIRQDAETEIRERGGASWDPSAPLSHAFLAEPASPDIRKTNPRGDLASFQIQTDEAERSFRISRRGITYGARPDLAAGSQEPPPDGDVGLPFMSYQSRIVQFVIQQDGSDSNDFVVPGTGVDAVLGTDASPAAQRWPLNGAPTGTAFTMANFVRFLGGEYFFAPSIPFIEGLVPPATS